MSSHLISDWVCDSWTPWFPCPLNLPRGWDHRLVPPYLAWLGFCSLEILTLFFSCNFFNQVFFFSLTIYLSLQFLLCSFSLVPNNFAQCVLIVFTTGSFSQIHLLPYPFNFVPRLPIFLNPWSTICATHLFCGVWPSLDGGHNPSWTTPLRKSDSLSQQLSLPLAL